MKIVEKFGEDIQPSEVAEIFERLSNNCYSAFGKPGNVKSIHLNQTSVGTDVLTVIAEVEA